jgi:hypothetical protein
MLKYFVKTIEEFKKLFSPFFEPKFIYGLLFGTSSFCIILMFLLGYDFTLYQGQAHLYRLLWLIFGFTLIYWRLGKIDNFKRFFLAYLFRSFFYVLDDSFFILNASVWGFEVNTLWYIQTVARNFTLSGGAFLFIHPYIDKSKYSLALFALNYGYDIISFIFPITSFTPIFYILEGLMIYRLVKT